MSGQGTPGWVGIRDASLQDGAVRAAALSCLLMQALCS